MSITRGYRDGISSIKFPGKSLSPGERVMRALTNRGIPMEIAYRTILSTGNRSHIKDLVLASKKRGNEDLQEAISIYSRDLSSMKYRQFTVSELTGYGHVVAADGVFIDIVSPTDVGEIPALERGTFGIFATYEWGDSWGNNHDDWGTSIGNAIATVVGNAILSLKTVNIDYTFAIRRRPSFSITVVKFINGLIFFPNKGYNGNSFGFEAVMVRGIKRVYPGVSVEFLYNAPPFFAEGTMVIPKSIKLSSDRPPNDILIPMTKRVLGFVSEHHLGNIYHIDYKETIAYYNNKEWIDPWTGKDLSTYDETENLIKYRLISRKSLASLMIVHLMSHGSPVFKNQSDRVRVWFKASDQMKKWFGDFMFNSVVVNSYMKKKVLDERDRRMITGEEYYEGDVEDGDVIWAEDPTPEQRADILKHIEQPTPDKFESDYLLTFVRYCVGGSSYVHPYSVVDMMMPVIPENPRTFSGADFEIPLYSYYYHIVRRYQDKLDAFRRRQRFPVFGITLSGIKY